MAFEARKAQEAKDEAKRLLRKQLDPEKPTRSIDSSKIVDKIVEAAVNATIAQLEKDAEIRARRGRA